MTLAGTILTALMVMAATAMPAAAQNDRGGLGGVLDTLGGILGGGTQKLHGTVVLVKDPTMVIRTDDQRSYRVDLASADPQARRTVQPGQTVNVTVHGGTQGNVLSASEVQVDQGGARHEFRQLAGAVEQGGGASRLVFRTRDGLSLPIDVSQLHGLPFFAPNQPATLIYEQGAQQQVVAVWLEPGAPQPSASSAAGEPQPAASAPTGVGQPAAPAGRETIQGTVGTIGVNTLGLQTTDGRNMKVDTGALDRQTVQGIRPGDRVTVTGEVAAQDLFVAQTIHTDERAR
jgi:hypothetical protein